MSSRSKSPVVTDEFAEGAIAAIQNSPILRQRLLDMLMPTPATPAVGPIISSPLNINHSIIASVMSLNIAVVATAFPTLSDTHRWYSGIVSFIGVAPSYPLLLFSTWVHPPKVLTDNEQAAASLQTFVTAHPYAIHGQNLLPTDARYPLMMAQMNSSIKPLPVFPATFFTPLDINLFLFDTLPEYYVHHGTVCALTILDKHMTSLQQRIPVLKFPTYDVDHSDPLYHLGWILFSSRQELVKTPTILTTHFKTIRQAKDGVELSTRNIFISALNLFFKQFGFALDLQSKAIYDQYKELLLPGFTSATVRDYVKTTLFPHCTSITVLIRSIVQHESLIQLKIAEAAAVVKSAAAGGGALVAAAGPPVHAAAALKIEGKRARRASVGGKVLEYCTNPSCKKTTDHITYECTAPCSIPNCPCPAFPHPTKKCPLLHLPPSAKEHFAAFEVRHRSSSIPSPRRPLPTTLRALKSSWIPSIKFDTGANVIVSPIPLSAAPISACDDVIHVANGAAVPISSITNLGNQPCYIAPSFDSALIPQSAIESQGALSVMYNNQLLIFETTANPALTTAISSATPMIISNQRDGDYDISLPDIRRLFLTPPSPSCYSCLPVVKKASIARYYTSQFNTLKDLVLYWHVALDHANEKKMLSIVENKCISNIPDQLTPAVIRKYFKLLPRCIPCATATLQQVPSPPSRTSPRPPPGEEWFMDADKQSGSDNPATTVTSLGGFTHMINAVDFGSGRAYTIPSKGTANIVTRFETLWAFNDRHGYTMKHLYVDDEFDTVDMHRACDLHHVTLHIGIPYEHQSLGLVERFNRTMSEAKDKKMQQPHIKPSYWCLAYTDSVDMWNSCPTPDHPTLSPYQLYDKVTPDALASPLLPWGTRVVGHIPLVNQTTHSLRGKEYLYVGRDTDNFGAIQLLNPLTKRVITRRTFKVMGSHPVQNMAFTTPINLLFDPIADADDDPSTPPDPAPPADTAPGIPVLPPVELNTHSLHYRPVSKFDAHPSQRRYYDNVGRSFAELADDGRQTAQWIIHDVVCAANNRKAFYYKYYDAFLPSPPTDVDEFEYSLCSIINRQTWARFDVGELTARAIKLSKKKNLPHNFEQMLRHPDAQELLEAFLVEHQSWVDHGAIKNLTVDPNTIPPELIGDLMILWDAKYHADGTFDKWKCRIVFRGDKWINTTGMATYASSAESKALLVFLALVATLDYDLWALDVKTAFLHGTFPEGVQQFVRKPHGVPEKYFPKIFELGKAVYGHPSAGNLFEDHHIGVYTDIGFVPLRSTTSMYQIPKTPATDQVISSVIVDDCIMATPFGSPMKQIVMDKFKSHYVHTTKDPLVNINGCTLHRERDARRIGITQPLFLDNMMAQYPLDDGTEYPSVPYPYGDYISADDRTHQTIYLSASDKRRYQKVLGEILWLKTFSKPEIAFAHQRLSRVTEPTLYDYNLGVRTIQYCIGTRDKIRWLGGPHGPIITATVDTSFAPSHNPDLKSQSSWSVHLGGGGASIFDAKKQTVTADSSAAAEAGGTYMSFPDIKYASNILEELGFPQPTAMGIGQDNTSTIKIFNHKANKRKSRHLDLRYNIVRENIENEIIRLFYLPTDHMIADIGTKALSPAVFIRLRDYLLGHTTLPQFLDYIQEHAPHFLTKGSDKHTTVTSPA